MTKKRSTSRRKPARARSSKKKRDPLISLTPDQKWDLAGGGLLLLAVLTFLSLISPQQGTLTALWISALGRSFGWGMILAPLFTGALGLWLLLRRFGDRIPHLEPEQLLGIVLGCFVALTTLHFIAARIFWPEVALYALAAEGTGGGYVGAVLLDLGLKAVGTGGVVVTLLMGWLIVVAFTAGLSPAEALRWLFNRSKNKIVEQPRTQPPVVKTSAPQPLILGETRREPQSKKTLKINGRGSQDEERVNLVISPAPDGSPWRLPVLSEILEVGSEQDYSITLIRQQARTIEETLASLGAPVKVMETNMGPVIIQFGVEPQFITMRSGKRTKVKVSKIAALADDLALALSARSIRIEAPIPGKGLVGIEVPNIEPTVVSLRDVMESRRFSKLKGMLRLGLGQDVSGQAVGADLRIMPHLLIAGTTGSGKSVCVNAILTALLLQNTPDTLRMLMIDPKRVELTQYNRIPHLLSPVIVDVERVVPALRWIMREMDSRYRRFAKIGARNIEDHNRRAAKLKDEEQIPYIVVVVDELADLMLQSPEETERTICRLAQMARATGIHLILATQRPSVDVVTGLIKANFPARIAFAVASSVDSRVILDTPGAERLLGRGDMLFMPPDVGQPLRLQGTFVSDRELARLITYWRGATEPATTQPKAVAAATPPELQAALKQPALFPEFQEPTT
ncbi:MAG: DNA translocase FtsK, partial [Chloroflexota bacterium]|nr:DNA translocase FtsK [Chloroflexota bacterium]